MRNCFGKFGATVLILALSTGVANAAGVCVNSTKVGTQISAANEKKNWENLEDLCQEPLFLVDGATLGGNPAYLANTWGVGTTGIIFEGSAANTSETLITVANPTADRTITFPDATGTVALTSDIGAGDVVSAGKVGGQTINGGLTDLAGSHLYLYGNAELGNSGSSIRLISTPTYEAMFGVGISPNGGQITADFTNGVRIISGDGTIQVEPTFGNVTVTTPLATFSQKLKATTSIQVVPVASPPTTCNAGSEGTYYSDTSHASCFCDGTTWQKLVGAGTCA